MSVSRPTSSASFERGIPAAWRTARIWEGLNFNMDSTSGGKAAVHHFAALPAESGVVMRAGGALAALGFLVALPDGSSGEDGC